MNQKAFDKFVRLNLTGQIVEVVHVGPYDITIKFDGKDLTMEHHEVSRIAPEEAMAVTKRSSGY